MKKLILFFLGILPICLFADSSDPKDTAVSFDEVVISEDELAFVTDWKAQRPDLSDFEIEYRRFMSNDLGQRFALVTFSRQKAGVKSIKKDDIVGIFANGQRFHPISLDGETEIGALGSILVHFGKHQFPLVGLETRTE